MNRKTTVKNFIVDMDHVIVLPEQSVAVVTQFKIRTSTTFIQNLVLRAGADSYYSITMSRTERQATSVPPVVRPRRQVIPPRYLTSMLITQCHISYFILMNSLQMVPLDLNQVKGLHLKSSHVLKAEQN